MAKFPSKPQKGAPALQAIYNSVCDIIDYLPSLKVIGDNKTTSVNQSIYGTTIHAFPSNTTTQGGRKYEAGSGLSLTGNVFNVEIDPNTMAIVDNRLSCTIEGGGGEGTDHKYCDNGCSSLIIAPSSQQINGWNYIGVNPDWIAGNGMCSEGYFAVMSAILKAFSGTNQSTPFAIGSESIQTYGTEIWVNPYWLAGYTTCSAGFYGICSAVYRYLNALPVTDNGDTLKKGGDMGFYWGVDATGGSGGDDYVYKYADPFSSIVFASNSGSVYNSEDEDEIGANYIYVNDAWLAGDTPCKAGFMAIESAIIRAMSGDSNTTVLSNSDEDIKGIGSESVSTYMNEIWVNPAWLSGGTNCQAGYESITGAIAKYLNSLTVVETDGNTLKKDGSNGFGWYKDNAGTGGDGDHVFKYADPFSSLIFASNSGSVYNEDESKIGENNVYINVDWLAGNTECQAGYDAICSTVYKYLTGISTYDATSCTLKINPTDNTLYWGEVKGSLPTIPSTGLTSGALVDGNGITTGIAFSISAVNEDKVLSCHNGTISWETNNSSSPPPPGDGDHVFKYSCGDTSIYFASNSGSVYDEDEDEIGDNLIGVSQDWLAGNGECQAGYEGVASAIYKYLTKSSTLSTFDATSCTLKINPTTSALYWGEDLSGDSAPSTVYDLLEEGPNIKLTKLSNGKTQISGAAGGSSPTPTPAGSGIPWPNYANLNNNGRSISIQQDYTVDSAGGWLRISYKGTATDNQCHSLMIDGNAVGMYTLNSALGQIGNTWILPIPPFSRFMVNFPSDKTYAYFDGALYDSGDVQTLYATMIEYCNEAEEACEQAEQKFNYAKSCADSASGDYQCIYNDPPNPYQPPWYWDLYYTARRYVTGYINAEDPDYNESGSIHYAAEAAEYATLASTEATRMINAQEDVLNRANSYATEAANWATSASNWSAAASGAADDCYNWYLSACAWWNVTPHAKDYPNND